jgi:hypothetical protein
MVLRTHRALALLSCMAALCGSLCAQAGKTITIRILDGKTGKPAETSTFLVRIDHQPTLHGDWVVQNEDGTGTLTLPRKAILFAIQGTYDSSEKVYVNCDSAGQKENPVEHWYTVSEILATGIIAPNECAKALFADKSKAGAKHKPEDQLAPAAKPGEFVFFVRKRNMREEMQDDYSSH